MTKLQYKKNIELFINNPPYYDLPYSKKNWGNKWHSLCSYHGKLKPAIAHFLIKNFTKEGDVVLDPMAGVGTIPFEAALQGRVALGSDLSKLAYIVSNAKLNICKYEDLLIIVNMLDKYIKNGIKGKRVDRLVKKYEDFGMNKTLKEYFHKDTFKEILLARDFFNKKERLSNEECIIFSCFLHILHGNRPYALSRKSHPLTPYAPKGEYIYKSVIECIRNKLAILYKDINKCQEKYENNFSKYLNGKMHLGDVLKISKEYKEVDFIITSPPFVGSLRFYTQNWMRLWLSGWEQKDFKNAEKNFLESKQKKDISIYKSVFDEFYKVLKPKGKVILHLGKTDKFDMAKELLPFCEEKFKLIYIGEENVKNIQKHGIKDKGSTNIHQFMFLEKR